MKTDITIFVSGSKKLKEHRLRLKALVNNLNGENRMKGIPVTLNMFSYVNLGDNQADYDVFIKNKSDIVIFIVEDRIGDKTKEEFLLATQGQKRNGKPKNWVFIKESQIKTPEIEDVERLVNENSESYYIDYSNLEDLEYKVKQRLMQEVDSLIEKSKVSPHKKIRTLKIWAWIATVAFLFLSFVSFWHIVNKDDDVILLFIGGGSAVRCLEEKCPEVGNAYYYDNSICISVPTSSSWPIVTSEIMHHHAAKGGRVSKPFYPVCMSAMEADVSDFLKMSNRDQFIDKGSVLSYYLGDDELTLYVKKSYHHELIDDKDSIGVEDLAAFLKSVSEQNVMIFTTEVGSGTLTNYQRILGPYNITISKEMLGEHVDRFTDLTPKSKIRRDETPYIMLGSHYYVAKEVYDEGDCRPLIVLDETGTVVKKTNYLYFAGYKEDEGSSFWIPTAMVTLLKKIDTRFGDIIKNNRIPRNNETVIVSLNDYLPN